MRTDPPPLDQSDNLEKSENEDLHATQSLLKEVCGEKQTRGHKAPEKEGLRETEMDIEAHLVPDGFLISDSCNQCVLNASCARHCNEWWEEQGRQVS